VLRCSLFNHHLHQRHGNSLAGPPVRQFSHLNICSYNITILLHLPRKHCITKSLF
jgi:hypothetical protein